MTNNLNRIALFLDSFREGGAERVMVILANTLSEWGYTIDLLVVRDIGIYKEQLSSKVNKIVLIKSIYSENILSRIVRKFLLYFNLFIYFRFTPPDVLMATMRRNNLIVSRIYHLAFCHFPLILREASLLNIEHKRNFKKIEYWYKKASYIVANSDMTMKDFIEKIHLNDNKIIRIYNPLIIPKTTRKSKKDNIIILGCGRFVAGKNFSELIRAMKLIEADIPNAELVIIGDGEDRHNLERQIGELNLTKKVSLPGLVANPYAYYSLANVFVQTSLYEGFGYVLAEAMACGTPVVAYDALGAMREILDNGKYGILVESHNIEALRDAIIAQINNPTPDHILREAAARFEKDKIVREYLMLFERSLRE